MLAEVDLFLVVATLKAEGCLLAVVTIGSTHSAHEGGR